MVILKHFKFLLKLARGLRRDIRVLLAGPPGASKTSAAYWLANQLRVPIFEFRCHYGLLPQDLLFEYQVRPGNRIEIQKSAIWKAIEASSSETVILLIDEIEKLSEKAEAILLRLLETAEFISPFDEKVSGRIQNLIVIATSNETRELQEATLRRFPFRLRVGFPPKDVQIQIVRVNLHLRVPDELIRALVDIAETLRAIDPNKAPSYHELARIAEALWIATPESYSEFLQNFGYSFWKGDLNEVRLPRLHKFVQKLKKEVNNDLDRTH